MSRLKIVSWIEQPNLGDRFTDLWLTHQGYDHTVTDKYAEGNFIGVGSLLEQCQGHDLTIWGTGRATDPRRTGIVDISKATVLALRGPLSALGAYGARSAVNSRKGFVMGEPGLLAADLLEDVPPRDTEYGTVYVPHWTEYERVVAERGEGRTVNMLGDPIEALQRIREAALVISSSLHGLVFADAFGVERIWEYSEAAVGDPFKFRDYAALVGRFEPDDSVKVADSIVRDINSGLREVFDLWAMNHAS